MVNLTALSLSFLLAVPAAAQVRSSAAKTCCAPPLESAPRPPRRRALCKGTVWSTVRAGRCEASEGDVIGSCRDNALTTLINVREFILYWDERQKTCIVASTGRVNVAPAETCDGDPC